MSVERCRVVQTCTGQTEPPQDYGNVFTDLSGQLEPDRKT